MTQSIHDNILKKQISSKESLHYKDMKKSFKFQQKQRTLFVWRWDQDNKIEDEASEEILDYWRERSSTERGTEIKIWKVDRKLFMRLHSSQGITVQCGELSMQDGKHVSRQVSEWVYRWCCSGITVWIFAKSVKVPWYLQYLELLCLTERNRTLNTMTASIKVHDHDVIWGEWMCTAAVVQV